MFDINRLIRRRLRISGQEVLPYIGKYTRNRLGELFCELGYKVGAEIGVFRGDNAETLLKGNPGLKLFCIDPWAWEGLERWFGRIQVRLASYDVTYIRKTSMEALEHFPDNFLDFVYIDALHDFDNAMRDIIEWSKKVRHGGIVAGHEYIHMRLDRAGHSCGVIAATKGYVEGHGIQQWFVTSEPIPTFFWVKS